MMTGIDTSKPYPLTWADLEAYQPNKPRARNRYYCPVHGSDNQTSLIVDPDHPQIRWKCMNPECHAWGYLSPDQNWKPEPKPKPRTYLDRPQKRKLIQAPAPKPEPAPQVQKLSDLQVALPDSAGSRYLAARGISLETAQRYGLGYSCDGSPLKLWKWGRVIIPHTDPTGAVISLYGRAIDGITDKQAPKDQKHMHLQGKKGIFNAPALLQPTVFICEGAFDALALLEAGYPACAIYGLHGLPWHWVEAQELIFCLDNDQAGSKAFFELAEIADDLGKTVYKLPLPDGYKDASQAWNDGRLDILNQVEPGLHLWMLAHWRGIVWDGESDTHKALYDAVDDREHYRELAREWIKA